MTDADLRALFAAWLAQPSSAHRTCDVIGAIVRHHGQAMLALPTYPPQIRAQSPAEAPPAAEEVSAGPGDPAEGRLTGTGDCNCPPEWGRGIGCGLAGLCSRWNRQQHAPAITHAEGSTGAVRASVSPAIGNPACVSPDADGERQPPAAITHAADSPLLRPGEDFAALHAARLDRREAWERGPIIPRRTEDRA